ncbi:hypothetical protein MD484_g24, partial [Candolleomyces efflorescens]
MPAAASTSTPSRTDDRLTGDNVGGAESFEMDTLPQAPAHGRSVSLSRRSMSRLRDKTPVPPSAAALNKRDYAVGILLLLSVVVLWTSSNFITQDLFEEGYDKPFLVTYMNTSAFSLYLIPFVIKRAWKRYRGGASETSGGTEDYQPLATDEDAEPTKPASQHDMSPLTVKETAQLAIIFCFFWFVANWTVNAALNFTSVASATVLSSMSGFFTLGIGRIFKVEKLTVMKIAAVVTSFTGVLFVSWSDSSTKQLAGPASRPKTTQATAHAPRPALGDALALVSALFYALYVILLKVRIKAESRIDMQLFFGFVGLFNVLTCWPIGVVLHFLGFEVFELPTSRMVWTAVLINMGITLSSDYLYVLAMLKTTPLVVTVGLSLTIPFAVVGDFIRGRPSSTKIIIGALLVLADTLLRTVDSAEQQEPTLTKKEKQAMKREAFMQKLDNTRNIYSKSHNRRMKRKAKEQIANGMSDIQSVLAALEDPLDATTEAPAQKGSNKNAMETEENGSSAQAKPTASSKSLKIGEGKAAPLSKSQRKRALELERLRHPLILTNPSFASDPFSTIRLHAQNTLLKHQTPT